MKLPLLLRAAAIGAVAVAILVPIQLIRGKVAERQALAESVVSGFAAETSGPQVLVGPFLALTCEEAYDEERQVMRGGKAETIRERKVGACPTGYFTPRTFEANANVPVESLHRGIYPIRLYRAALKWRGEFDWPAPPESSPTHQRTWKQAFLVSYVRDPRGIKTIGSSTSSWLLAGLGEPGVEVFSIREDLGAWGGRAAGTRLEFSYEALLAGTSSLEIAPVGDRNEIRLESDWPHPSFGRAWSPDERSIRADGFTALWRINSVATGGNAAWKRFASTGKLAEARGAGVSLFDPVNVYSLSYRATEYAFLFVLFTFGAFGLTEVLAGVRLHPVQYALVGSAIAVFFLLVLALSEHLAFAHAYGIAATTCVTLMTYYLRVPLGSLGRTSLFFAGFGAMYGTLFVLLQSEDHALLMGSLLVFALLAAIMVTTRRVDWSNALASLHTARGPKAP